MYRGAYNQNTLWNILFGTSLKIVKASCQGTLQAQCPTNKDLTSKNALPTRALQSIMPSHGQNAQ